MSLEANLLHDGGNANATFISHHHWWPWSAPGKDPQNPTLFDNVFVRFTNMPTNAERVRVSVFEDLEFNSDQTVAQGPPPRAKVTDRLVATFDFEIRDGAICEDTFPRRPGSRTPGVRTWGRRGDVRDALQLRILLEGVASSAVFIPLPEAYRVKEHTLHLAVTGVVDRREDAFFGKHRLEVRYPMALVAPESLYRAEPLMNYLRVFPDQWRDYDVPCRSVVLVPVQSTSQLGVRLRPEHFDDIIDRIMDATATSGTGVVFVHTGHAALPPDEEPLRMVVESGWISLAPEDPDRRPRRLVIHSDELINNEVESEDPPHADTRVRLNALDRLCDKLHPTGADWSGTRPLLRRFIVHSCRAGFLVKTLQALANRLQVPVLGHRAYLSFRPLTQDEFSEYEYCRLRDKSRPHAHTFVAGYHRTDYGTRATVPEFHLPDGLHYLQNAYLGEVYYPKCRSKRWPLLP